MTKTKRDYCNKGRHPNWCAWRAEYDMSTTNWKYIGSFCTYCGAPVRDTKGSGPPDTRAHGRLRALRGEPATTVWG